jgi:glutamine synthetase
LEDRRPGANADPYIIAARLIATICDVEAAFTYLADQEKAKAKKAKAVA